MGKRGRVAMLAVDDNGRPYQGEGFVTNEKGDVLASVQTDSLGRGLFELVPDSGQLTLQMVNLKDKMQKFPLPQIQQEGCVLSFDAVSEQMLAELTGSGGALIILIGINLMGIKKVKTANYLPAVLFSVIFVICEPFVKSLLHL